MTGFDSKRQASKSLAANPWRDAIDSGLVCAHIGTIESFPTAQAALAALINWHIATALDPAVSASAKLLVDRGRAAVAEPLNDWEFVAMWATAAEKHDDKYNVAVEFGRAVEARHGIKGSAK